MSLYARIADGRVAEPLVDYDGPITDLFHADQGWIDVTAVKPAPAEGSITADGGKTFAAPVVPPLTPAQLAAYATGAVAAKLAAGETFNVAASGQTAVSILCDGTNDTRADLALLALFGQQNPSGTKTWIDNKGVATVLTGTQLVNLSTLAGNWISDCYPALASVLAGIASGKVTTTAAIDSAFAAVTA